MPEIRVGSRVRRLVLIVLLILTIVVFAGCGADNEDDGSGGIAGVMSVYGDDWPVGGSNGEGPSTEAAITFTRAMYSDPLQVCAMLPEERHLENWQVTDINVALDKCEEAAHQAIADGLPKVVSAEEEGRDDGVVRIFVLDDAGTGSVWAWAGTDHSMKLRGIQGTMTDVIGSP